MRFISSGHGSGLWGLPATWLGSFLILFAMMLALPGCGGCRSDPKTEAEKEAERLAREREAKKPDFELSAPVSQPAGYKERGCRYKPGHWTSAIIEAKANKDDFVGDLEISLLWDKGTKPVGLEAVPYWMNDWRAVALSKGRPKGLLGSFFVPPTSQIVSGRLNLNARRGYARFEAPFSMTRMLAYQYHFVVLARSPDRYAFVRSLYTIKPPRSMLLDDLVGNFDYWVALVKVDRQTPLPEESLFWTSIAYVLWDDVDPKSLTPDQQRALVDWLHWGGQLIVSGPDTLDTLRDSFLADYLPASAAGQEDFKPADFDELNDHFTLAGQKPLAPVGAWSVVRLRPAAEAQYVPGTGRLLAERRVGRGRIVVSSMRLSDRSLIEWPGFDGWFNACLLRRPARIYESTEETEEGVLLHWADAIHRPDDAALNCNLRYFSRDAGIDLDQYTYLADANSTTAGAAAPVPSYSPGSMPGLATDPKLADGCGVAAWRNFSPTANRARAALQNAACVEVPGRWFVIWIVLLYLAVLVPLNWSIFAMLRRVEWAWAAAPLIAIGCTVAVVHVARLDIGFARSETTVGVLEIQGNYSRAHLTCYMALYTSLTTQYEFRQDSGGLVQPFPTVGRRADYRPLMGQGLTTLVFWRGKNSRLLGFSIPSNLVDFVHAEQMTNMEGALTTLRNTSGGWDLINRTGIPLHGVGVVRRDESGQIETAWVGELDKLNIAPLNFVRPAVDKAPWWPDRRAQDKMTREIVRREENPTKDPSGANDPLDANDSLDAKAENRVEIQPTTKGQINLRALTNLAEKADDLRPGEMRLIAWTDAPVGSFEVLPAAPQSRQTLLVVAHLQRAFNGPPEPDRNTKEQVLTQGEP
ncbi:MAG: hypothetical protein JW719_07725 [Pirellulales bacterium]|nr:hypothetical protein [Pirellulales bacterium]